MANPNLPIAGNYNTYVGARYVPKFANKDLGYQWTNTRKYEPLEIVLYQGNSYTSTTFVPVGVDINNTTYWANTGNYNAQIESYRELVEQYQEQVENVQADLNNIPYQPKANIGKMNRNIIIIGDSYTTNYEIDGVSVTSWSNNFKGMFPNFNVYINAVGGASMGYPEYNNRIPFSTLLTELIPSIPDKTKITDIFIVSGGNEGSVPTENLSPGFTEFQKICVENFPNAQIYLFSCGVRLNVSPTTFQGRNLARMVSLGTSRKMIVYENIYKCLYNMQLLCSDLVHPNNAGMNALAISIANAWNGGRGFYQQNLIFSMENGFSGSTWLDENGIYAEFEHNEIVFENNLTFGNEWVKIGECREAMIASNPSSYAVIIPVVFEIGTTGSFSYQCEPCWIQFRVTQVNQNANADADIYLRLYNPFDPSTGNPKNISVRRVIIDHNTVVFPYMNT